MGIILALPLAVITGCIADTIGKPKNIKGFWWGFLLSVLGIIIVALMPYNNVINTGNSKSNYEKLAQLQELREKKAITEEEFKQEKERLLN